MTIIEQIKAEIERLKAVQLKRIQEGNLVDAEPYDKIEAYNELIDFIYTLESEKPMEQNAELNEEIKKEMVKLPFFIRGKDQIAFARHFAEWGAEHAREQMKEAVEADIMLTLHDKTGDISLHTGYLPKELGIKCDDKVRIIIIKE